MSEHCPLHAETPLSTDGSALMIVYLLSGSWIPLFFSVLRHTSLHAKQGPAKGWKHKMIPTAFTFQGFVMVGLVISVFYAWSAYGSDAACNSYRVLSFLHPFPVTATVQAVAMAGFGALPVACVLVVSSGVPLRAPRVLIESMLGSAAALAVLMSLWIANVELLRIYNKPQSGEEAWVSFGQVSRVHTCRMSWVVDKSLAARRSYRSSRLSGLYRRCMLPCGRSWLIRPALGRRMH
jgi:hypothetical protein